MQTVAIVGVGLIGASFGLALRKAGFTGEIIGVSSPAAIASGLERQAISSQGTLAEATARADLIYLAQPVDRILTTLEQLGPLIRPACLVTDAGSTKAAIVEQAEKFLPSGTFIGGHPMAGKEQRGAEAADADLFRNRPYVLTGSPASAQAFRSWLAAIGAKVIEMSPQEHDHIVALTSHLPQLVSTALALTLARERNLNAPRVSGPGLIDMTRLALSAPDLWLSILSTNRTEVIAALDRFIDSVTAVRQAIGTAGLADDFAAGASFASEIRKIDS